jgi:hypothetical protein
MRDSIDLLRWIQEAAERFIASHDATVTWLRAGEGVKAPPGLLDEMNESLDMLKAAVKEARGA